MEPCLREVLAPDLPSRLYESSDSRFKGSNNSKKSKEPDYFNIISVNYKFNEYLSRENKKIRNLSDVEYDKSRNRTNKIKNRNFFRCIVHFSLLFIIWRVMYNRNKENMWKKSFKLGREMPWEVRGLRFVKYTKAEEYNQEGWEGNNKQKIYEIEEKETKDQLVASNMAIVEKIDTQPKLEEVSLLVLDTEGLAYRTDFTKKLIWATRLTEDLLRVQKPMSTVQETCALEDIAKDNINKDKTIGHQIFCTKNVKDKNNKKGTKSNKEEEKYNQDYKYERLKSHLVPSYDGYVYYVDDFNTKLLQVHVKDIVNYTPFYTPLLEGVYLEGSRNSLVIALDYETGTYITRHNREEDTKNNYGLNYIVQEGKNQQLHVGITNWSVKAYTEKDHTQIWDFDWLEVGSVMSQTNNEAIVNRIKNSISVKSNRLFFNDMSKKEGINNLAFPFPISSVFAIFKTHRKGIYTLEMLERVHIPPPPNFLYNSSMNSLLSSSRKITHKSLYVENGVIGVLDDSKLVTLVDDNTMVDSNRIVNKKLKRTIGQNKRLLLEDGKNKNQDNMIKGNKIGIGVDEKGIIVIGSSVVKRETRMTKKERTTEFLFRWWWLLITWVMVMIATPFYWALTKLRKSRKKALKAQKEMINTTENSLGSRTEVYDSKTEVYDSSDESNEETNIVYRKKSYKKVQEDELSDMSVDRKLSIDEINKKELSNEIRRAKSEGNFEEVIENDFTESVWMEEQSLINVLTNNQFQVKRKKDKLPKMLTIQYENKINNKGIMKKEEITTNVSTTVSNGKKEEESKKQEQEKEKEQKEDKEKDEPKLSVIPKGSILSKFLENGRFLRTFECIKMLGKGGFGSVYRARHKLEPGNPIYAIKFVLLKLKATEDLSSRRYFREVAANRDIYSKYVVRYYTWWCEEPHFLPLAQMSTQLQMAAINNIRYLIQNKIIPEDIINPENQNKGEEIISTEKNNMLNKYIKEYREIIYEYIQNPKQDDLFPNFSQIAQKNKQNNNKGTASFNPNKEENNLYMFSENSNIQFKESSNTNDKEKANKKNDDKEEEHKENNGKAKVKEKLPIINEYESNKFNENKQYQVVLLILMEMCKGLTLREWLNRSERRNKENDNKKIEFLLFKQIIKGLRDIHRNCFIHRDLKPENIFVDEKNNLKIGDLGLVGFIQESHPNSYQPVNTVKQHLLSDATQVSVRGQVIGTPGYTAPEGGGNCTEKVDIYSAALILLELLCPRFSTVMERLETLEKFRKNHEAPDFIKERYKPWYELMVQMADSNPENRPSADQVYRQLKLILNSQ